MWLWVNSSCPPGHRLAHPSIQPSIHPSIHPSIVAIHPSLLPPPLPSLPLRCSPKAANNPLHLQRLRTLQPAKSRACDLASTTTESGRKREKCRERRRGLSVEGDDERARRTEEEEGRWREREREREKTVVSGHIRHIENTL